MPRPGPGQWCVARQVLDLLSRHRVCSHDLVPLGPLGVGYLDGDRPAQSAPVPHPAQKPNRIGLELHSGASAHAKPPAREIVARCPPW